MNNTTSFTKMHNEMIKLRERAESAEAELLAVREDNHSMMLEIHSLRIERDALAAELAKLMEQKPYAYVDYWKSDGTGIVRKQRTTGAPLYAAPVAAPAVPDWNVNIERIRDVMHMLGISIDESVECFYAALPTNINRMTLAMKRHLQELAGMTAITTPTPFQPDDDTRRNDAEFAAQKVLDYRLIAHYNNNINSTNEGETKCSTHKQPSEKLTKT